jgi:hypothetical protein
LREDRRLRIVNSKVLMKTFGCKWDEVKEGNGEHYIMKSLMVCRPTPHHLEKPSLDGRIILRSMFREWGWWHGLD